MKNRGGESHQTLGGRGRGGKRVTHCTHENIGEDQVGGKRLRGENRGGGLTIEFFEVTKVWLCWRLAIISWGEERAIKTESLFK